MFSLIEKILPHSCVFCGDTRERKPICHRCINILPWNEIICQHCGQPVSTVLPPAVPCAACQQRLPAYAKARSLFHYAFPVDRALKAMKFNGQLMYAPAFASLLAPLQQSAFGDCDLLVAVPLHRWRHITRGYNQASELCNELARLTGVRQFRDASRVKATRTQSGLTAARRRENLQDAFAVKGEIRASYPLIVDDVITTGATCEHLAQALLDAGADRVGVLTVARSSTLPV